MSNEWYTPSKYIEAAREVMGTIDLDPASCEHANKTVQATTYYTQEQDGLSLPWHGNVWLNPPYSSKGNVTGMRGGKMKGLTGPFLEKLLSSDISQAIVCLNADTVRTWFTPLWAFPICFPYHAISFLRPNLATEHQFFGTCFVYIGSNEQKFRDVFSQFGHVVMPERVTVS